MGVGMRGETRNDVVLARRDRKFLEFWEARLASPSASLHRTPAQPRPMPSAAPANAAATPALPTVVPWTSATDVFACFDRVVVATGDTPPPAAAAAL